MTTFWEVACFNLRKDALQSSRLLRTRYHFIIPAAIQIIKFVKKQNTWKCYYGINLSSKPQQREIYMTNPLALNLRVEDQR